MTGLRRLQLYMGPMWSGKTNRLLQEVDAARQAYPGAVVLIKPVVDTRHGGGVVMARTGLSAAADACVHTLDEVVVAPDTLYAVDEAQFFGDSLLRLFARIIAAAPTHAGTLLVSSLDYDYARRPFGSALELARQALTGTEPFTLRRLTARCAHGGGTGTPCARPAPFTQRFLEGGAEVVRVGDGDVYAPACVHHHRPHPIPRPEWWGVGTGDEGGARRGGHGASHLT